MKIPYSSFSLDEVEQKFNLQLQAGHFLPVLKPIVPSSLLQQVLAATLPLAQETGSEKARSEFIIDAEEYGLSPVDRILSILKWMVVGDSS